METLIVASNNKGKIKEIKQILGGLFDVKSMGEIGIKLDVEETGMTFEENAVIKATAIFNAAQKLAGVTFGHEKACDFSVLSDDSGLAVDALNGEPGVFSARYSAECTDEANNQKLLKNLEGKNCRKGRFISAVALVRSSSDILVAQGECEGEILHEKVGEGGFGYDPLFYSSDLKKSFGEATCDEKNAVSHRAKALQNLLNVINM